MQSYLTILSRLPELSIRAATAILTLTGLGCLYFATAKNVLLVEGAQTTQIWTHARTVEAALRDASIVLNADDKVSPTMETPLEADATIELTRARPVLVEAENGLEWINTVETFPANILADSGYRLFPGDQVWADGIPLGDPASSSLAAPARLRIKSAVPLTLETSGASQTLLSGAGSIGQALYEQGIVLYEADRISLPPDTRIEGPVRLSLQRSRSLKITADGAQIETRAVADTVGEALDQAGIALNGHDYAKPPWDRPLPRDGNIRVIRVTEKVLVEQTPIRSETVFEPLPDLEIDNQRLLDSGSFGVRARRVRVRFQDGQEVRRFLEGEWVARQAEPRRVGYGTNIVVRTMGSSDGTLSYWRAVRMYATSYSPSRAGVSPDAPNYGITASGRPLTKGLVAIDRRLIPFGTQMYVPGYGFALAADTGSGIRGRMIDLGYDDHNWISWHQYLTVYFLTPVPPAGSIVWIFP